MSISVCILISISISISIDFFYLYLSVSIFLSIYLSFYLFVPLGFSQKAVGFALIFYGHGMLVFFTYNPDVCR